MKMKYFKTKIEISSVIPEKILLLSTVVRPISCRIKRKTVEISNDYTSLMFGNTVWIGCDKDGYVLSGTVRKFLRLFKDNLKRDRRFKKREVYTLTLKESK